VLRDEGADEVTHVAVLATLGAPRRPGRLTRSRPRKVQAEPEPSPVSTGRATIIAVQRPFAGLAEARTWLQAAGEAELADGLLALNRVLHAFRLVAADPSVTVIARDHLIAARIGYGSGDQVADGRFTDARELPEPAAPRGRRRVLAPQARLAAVLGGRERTLACAELVLRARVDLDAGRPREAALQTLIALDAGLAELASDPHAAGLAERLGELRSGREAVAAAAQAALSTTPGPAAQQDIEVTVRRLEAALRARVVAG
jgi:hypothetical protein